ncbi:glycosyltransferase family 4 protein [Candidatus Pacearchaeota archaeon]|nr:glycosyltransferase family 4 protein [Candidatus Pacearchaeota archaeon]
MKIVYFYQYFTTPKGSYGTRVYELAKRWIAQGHDVTVVTSVYYKSDIKAVKLVEDQNFEGINVKILNIEISNKQKFAMRVWSFIKFAILSSWFALTLKADVVIASSGPLTVGLPGLVAHYFRRRKFVFEVRDLWPDVSIEIGILKNPILISFAKVLEKMCYKASSLIVTLSPGMADHIVKTHSLDNVISVPNAADNLFWNVQTSSWQLPEWAVDRKLALYSGNIGAINNSSLLFDAAVVLKERGREDIIIMLIGDGQERAIFSQKAKELSLSTFRILDLMPKTELRNWLQRSMCSVIPLQDNPILDTSSPNKLFDSLACGIPVIQTTNGWIKEFISNSECGRTVSASDPKELADVLISLADSDELSEQMGANAKHLAKTDFDRDLLSNRMLNAIVNI